MIAVDTNILVYAHRRDAPFHVRAREVLDGLASGPVHWGIPWPCIHELLGNVTHSRIYRTPTPLAKALEQVEQWLRSPSVTLLSESDGYWDVAREVIARSGVSGPKVHDARIAALCIHHGVRELWTADRDFSRFGGLSTRNPLAEP